MNLRYTNKRSDAKIFEFNEEDEDVVFGVAAYLILGLIAIISFNLWTIVIAQRSRKEIRNQNEKPNKGIITNFVIINDSDMI